MGIKGQKVTKKVDRLKLNPKNPRKITDAKLKQLSRSMEEYGDISGIVFNRRTGHLVGGNQRSKDLDKTSKVVVTKRFEKPSRTGTVSVGYVLHKGERFAYREVDWPEAKETAAQIAANKNAGEWDDAELTQQLKDLGSFDVDYDLDLTMFDVDELTELGIKPITVAEHTRIGPGGTDEDEVPEVKEATIKMGDLYQLGNHRLLCGDSTVASEVDRLMNGEKADMVFTDPPYGIKRDKGFGGFGGFGTPIARRQYKDSWDSDRPSKECFDLMLSLATQSIIWGGNFFADYLPQGKHWLVWDKNNTMPTFGDCELAWTNIDRTSVKKYEFTYNGLIGKEKERFHPTQKPVALFEQILNDYEPKTVIDLFLGSGSTLIACEKTNRRCFGMEIDPHYCDVIVERWEKYTGQKAKLLNDRAVPGSPARSAKPKVIVRKKKAA